MNKKTLQNTVDILVDQTEEVKGMPTSEFEPHPSMVAIVAKCAANDDGLPPNAPAANHTGDRVTDADRELMAFIAKATARYF